jgi:hypothetical protein
MPSPFSAGARERGGEEADLWVGWVGEEAAETLDPAGAGQRRASG